MCHYNRHHAFNHKRLSACHLWLLRATSVGVAGPQVCGPEMSMESRLSSAIPARHIAESRSPLAGVVRACDRQLLKTHREEHDGKAATCCLGDCAQSHFAYTRRLMAEAGAPNGRAAFAQLAVGVFPSRADLADVPRDDPKLPL